jgi:hypothetical protein
VDTVRYCLGSCVVGNGNSSSVFLGVARLRFRAILG